MAHINIEFTLFSAFYSPLISLMSGGFLQAEGLEADRTVSPPGVSAVKALEEALDVFEYFGTLKERYGYCSPHPGQRLHGSFG